MAPRPPEGIGPNRINLMLASLPMYDHPEIRAQTDAWWRTIAGCLRREGVDDVPDSLRRDINLEAIWRSPQLLITQTCGYPLRHEFAGILTAIAAPSFGAPGCKAGEYSSAVVVREEDQARTFADLQGRCLAANAPDSQSGFNCIRDMVADLSLTGPFFGGIVWSGGHRRSLAVVRSGNADVAAIDAVTLALVQANAPAELQGLRILDWSRSVPALPYAATARASADLLARLRAGLHNAAQSTAASEARDALFIVGFVDIEDADYEPIVAMRQRSEASGVDLVAM